MKIPNWEFNEIIAKAVEIIKLYPDADSITISKLVCSPYQKHPDYANILFQVSYALVGLSR